MSNFLAIFPIHTPAPDARHHRQALNQLADIVPDNVTITGAWTGNTWTDPDHRHWYIMTAPAEGTADPAAEATVRATAHHIHPNLAQWVDGNTPPPPPPAPKLHRQKNASKPRLERLQELLDAGESVEDAMHACGWARPKSAGEAARRAGNLTLARTLEAAA